MLKVTHAVEKNYKLCPEVSTQYYFQVQIFKSIFIFIEGVSKVVAQNMSYVTQAKHN